MTATQLCVWGWLVHLVCDWAFQNDWMAQHKVYPEGLTHPASYAHAAVHLAGLLLVFPWWAAVPIAASHWLIDLRFALAWWRRVFGQDRGPLVIHVAIWEDQVAHMAIIGLAALCVGSGL